MQDNESSSVVTASNKSGGKKGIIIGIIAVLVLVAGVGVGIYLVGQNQEIRNQAAKFSSCSTDACTKCILDARSDILPFYDENGWSTTCANQTKIVNNWCGPTVDPNACQTIKTGQCASACAATAAITSPTPTATAVATTTPTPTATSSSTTGPTATPGRTSTPSPTPTGSARTASPTPTNRVSVVTSDQGIPQTGTGTPVIIGMGAGILLILTAIVLAL